MSDFVTTTTNKIKVGRATNGGVYSANPDVMGKTYLSVRETDAMREFFQHEADEKWGRWRSKIDPNWTAVRNGDVGVRFRHEDGLRSFNATRDNFEDWSSDLAEIAREYFEAHDEPKPWHDAVPGEIWRFAFEAREYNVVRTMDGWRFVVGYEPASLDSVQAGRRIWPEAQND